MRRSFIGLGASLVLLPVGASAHATFATATAPAESTYKAVLQVPHGCDGKATHTVTITMPEGMIAVKPMPKPGWDLKTVEGDYAKTYDYYGTPTSKGVRAVVWSNGDLPDAWYDEFVFRGYITGVEPGAVLAFPTVQGCDGAEARWDQVAAAGQDPDDLEHPAPTLTVVAPTGEEHHHHGGMAMAMTAAEAGDLTIENPWARETVAAVPNSAGYMTIKNDGDAPDRLVKAASDVAAKVELHTMAMEGDVAKMRPVDGVDVPAHGEADLAPGGLHIMLVGLKAPLKEGTSFPLTLTFEKAGDVTVEVPVEDIAHGGGHGDMDHMDHGN